MLSDDENIVDIQFEVQYRIKDEGARDYLFNSRNPTAAVIQAAESAMREVVGRKTMDSVLYESRSEDRRRSPRTHAGNAGSLRNRHPGIGRCDPERAAAGAGAGRVRRCGQGRAGPRAPDQRGPGICQRRRAQGARRGIAVDAGSRGLPHADRADRRGRCLALPPDADRVPEGAGGHARPHVPRHDAAGLLEHDQGAGRFPQQQPAAVSAVRQADAAGDAGCDDIAHCADHRDPDGARAGHHRGVARATRCAAAIAKRAEDTP